MNQRSIARSIIKGNSGIMFTSVIIRRDTRCLVRDISGSRDEGAIWEYERLILVNNYIKLNYSQ